MSDLFPQPSVPEEPVQPGPAPIIYVREPVRWEYRQLIRELDREGLLDEAALNQMGAEGWELAAALTHGSQAYYVFKRVLD